MLKQILQKYVDQQVKVVVFNSKSKSVRGWLIHTPTPPRPPSLAMCIIEFLLCIPYYRGDAGA
jgi:hypothetical protein